MRDKTNNDRVEAVYQTKIFPEEYVRTANLMYDTEAKTGDVIFIVADKKKVVASALGALRLKIGKDLELINKDDFKFLWVVDFPMFDYDEEEQRYKAEHHPFTSIKAEDLDKFLTGQTEDIHKMSGIVPTDGSYLKTGIKEMVKSRISWL